MTRGNYERFYKLIEKTFSVEEITAEKIFDEFYTGTFGTVKWGKGRTGKSKATVSGQSKFRGFAETLAEGGEIYKEIDDEEDYERLRQLKNRADDLKVHSDVVSKKAQAKMDEVLKEIKEIIKEREIEEKKEEVVELEEQKRITELEERKESIISDLNTIDDLTSLDNLKKRIKRLKQQNVDITEIENRVEEIHIGLEEQRAEQRRLQTEETLRRQAEVFEEQERLIEEGKRPEF